MAVCSELIATIYFQLLPTHFFMCTFESKQQQPLAAPLDVRVCDLSRVLL